MGQIHASQDQAGMLMDHAELRILLCSRLMDYFFDSGDNGLNSLSKGHYEHKMRFPSPSNK